MSGVGRFVAINVGDVAFGTAYRAWLMCRETPLTFQRPTISSIRPILARLVTAKSGTYLTKSVMNLSCTAVSFGSRCSAGSREEAAFRHIVSVPWEEMMHISDTAIPPKDLTMLQTVLDAWCTQQRISRRDATAEAKILISEYKRGNRSQIELIDALILGSTH